MLFVLPLVGAAAPDPAPEAQASSEPEASAAETQPSSAPDTPRDTLLVLQTRVAEPAAEKIDAAALTNVAGSVVSSLDRYQVVSHDDLVAMLDTETQKQLTGCDETSCMAEIGNALGARFLLYSHVGSVAGAYVCSASLIETERATAVDRQSVEVGDSRQVVDAMRVATLRLFGQEAELPPPPSDPVNLSIWKWSALGAGALCAAAGAAGTGLAFMFADQARRAEDQASFDSSRDAGDVANAVAVGGYVAGGVLLAGAGLLFAIDAVAAPDDGEEAQ